MWWGLPVHNFKSGTVFFFFPFFFIETSEKVASRPHLSLRFFKILNLFLVDGELHCFGGPAFLTNCRNLSNRTCKLFNGGISTIAQTIKIMRFICRRTGFIRQQTGFIRYLMKPVLTLPRCKVWGITLPLSKVWGLTRPLGEVWELLR